MGRKAPDFAATAVVNGGEIVENWSLGQFFGKKYIVLFFYPKDFTFVCPTELHALQHVEQYGEVCPIDWHKGDQAMTPNTDGLHRYFSK